MSWRDEFLRDEPPVDGAAALEAPCWGHDCARPAAPVQDARWRGRYCRECERLMAADAARMEEE